MPRSGGEADKLGNHYETVWTVDAVIDVFVGKCTAITVEPIGDDSKGVEFHLRTLANTLQFHSVKRQKQGGDWSIADLCRQNRRTGRCILGDLFEKRRSYPDAELRFVTATGANELRELCERAEAVDSFSEFKRIVSPKLQAKVDQRIVPLCDGDGEFALAALKSLEVVLRTHRDLIRTVEQRIAELFYRKDAAPLNPGDVRRMVAEFVLENLGRPLDTDRIRELFSTNGIGIRDWKTDATVLDIVAKINRRYSVVTETELINAAQIPRDETHQILGAISDPGSSGAILVGPGGFGKSCVLAQCLSQLAARDVPFLCLRMDSLEPCRTPRQLGEQLDLPASPAVVLAGIADNQPSVLVVDQLDAMSLVCGRNPKLWEVFRELCDEVKSYPHMKVILACRDFDLYHDHRLRPFGDPQSGYTKIMLGKLNKTELLAALDAAGICELPRNDRQLEILRIPFHLLLFLQGDPSRGFVSVGELYDRYWDRKRQKLDERLGRESHWNEVIEALTRAMSDRQKVFAPKLTVDRWDMDARAMTSEHVLVADQHSYRFFHESFFDYAYARTFCAGGRSLLDFLLSTEQHLFRRAQVRQILAYRREYDREQYYQDVREVLGSPEVRFHIRRMVASGFRQLDEPTRDEWSMLEPYLLESELSRYVSGAIRSHVGWFDLLDRLGVFREWLGSAEERLNNAVIWFFEAPDLQDSRSERIAELISPYIDRAEGWQQRIIRVLSWGKAYKSEKMAAIYLSLVARGAYDGFTTPVGGSDFWSQHYNAETECPKFVIDVLACWFDRTVTQFDDGESWNFLDKCPQNRSHVGAQMIGQAAAREPTYFVEQMLPRVTATVLTTEVRQGEDVSNRTWPWLSNHGDVFTIDDAVLLHLGKSLQWLAKNNVVLFRHYASTVKDHPHQTFAYLLMRAWADNPEVFASECAEYLAADPRRLHIGYSSWAGEGSGDSAVSRRTLRAISHFCSTELLEQLEATIIGYCDEYERSNPRWRGFSELLVLRSLERSRISRRAALRIEELERTFPNLSDEIPPEDEVHSGEFVGSPIPPETAEQMTDDQWISEMVKYDGSTDRFRGGPVELSRVLCDLVRKERTRFASLVARIPDDVDPMYFSAILDGLCSRCANLSKEENELDQREINLTPTQTFLAVVDRLHSLPGRPCGSAIAGCIRLLSDRQLPARSLEIVSFYAMHDPNPQMDVWQDDVDGKRQSGGDLRSHGINSVRGQAATAISALLYGDATRLHALRPALAALSKDPVIAVRTCAINAFLPLLNFARDEALELFLQACEGCVPICGTPPFERFVHRAMYRSYPVLRELLHFALNSAEQNAVENAARQIALAELGDVHVGSDASNLRSGTETMRKAAASVYATNLSHDVVGDRCAELLEQFFDDEAESVREKVSNAFAGLSGERLLSLQEFIARYIESRSFEIGTNRLLRALERSTVELPQIVCRAAERILEFLGEEGTHIAYHGSMTAMDISTLVVRQYEQTTDAEVKHSMLGSDRSHGTSRLSGNRRRIEQDRPLRPTGGGIKGGTIYGATDDFSYNIIEDPVHLRDFHATILHLLGFDHQRFAVRHQGLDQRLTGVEPARVIRELLA
jgi:hypothetical protein